MRFNSKNEGSEITTGTAGFSSLELHGIIVIPI